MVGIFQNCLTTDVGVAVFSDILNRRVKTLKLQISNPEPENAVKVPPMKPGKKHPFVSEKIIEYCTYCRVKLLDIFGSVVVVNQPVTRSTHIFQNFISGICRNVLRLWSRFRRNRAKAKENQMLTKPIFFCGGVRAGSIT